MLIQYGYRLGILVAATVLAGCGSAFEHLSLGEWREVGLREPPQMTEPAPFVVTTTGPGEGAGGGGGGPGREPPRSLADLYTFGSLGTAQSRLALIGRHLHEHFEIQVAPGVAG